MLADYPWTKPRKTDRVEFGMALLVYSDSPSRLDVDEKAVKKAKTILRRDAKLTRAHFPSMGTASIVEGPMQQSPPERKAKDSKVWKPYCLPLGWYAVGPKK